MNDRNQNWLIFGIAALIFVASFFLFSWHYPIFSSHLEIDGARFGQFGSFIGPIFTTASFLLLFFTWRNSQQIRDLNYINELYDHIEDDINSVTFINWDGIYAFYNFRADNHQTPNSVMNHLNSVLFSYQHLLEVARSTIYRNDRIREITLTRIHFLYYSKILWPVYESIWRNLRERFVQDNPIGTGHDDSRFLFPRYLNFSSETINYLSARNLIARKDALDLMTVDEPTVVPQN
jgi:hypothetical protein